MKRAWIAIVLALVGCASVGAASARATQDCPPPVSRPAQGDSMPSPPPAGIYRLVQVLTSFPLERPDDAVSVTRLRLAVPDSAQRADSRVRRIGHRPRRDLQLVGAVLAETGGREEPVEVDEGVLYLGCRDCNDASPEVLPIDAVSERGFVGSWADHQTGISRVVDRRTGKPTPNPAGYFCAWRE